MALCLAMYFFMESDFNGATHFYVGLSYHLENYEKENPSYYPGVLKQMGLPAEYDEGFFKDKILEVNHSPKLFLKRISSPHSSSNPVL